MQARSSNLPLSATVEEVASAASRASRPRRRLRLAVAAFLVAVPGALAINAHEASAASWDSTASLNESRSHHSETKLDNGKVLVVGGQHGNTAGTGTPTYRASAELFDPAAGTSGTWSSCPTASPAPSASCPGSLAQARSGHTATKLPNGKVLVVGGRNGGGALASAELYDPATGTWQSCPTATPAATASCPGPLVQARADHTATLLTGGPCGGTSPPAYCGKVLVAGGRDGVGSLATAELYDPASGKWSSFADPTTCSAPAPSTNPSSSCPGPLTVARADHTATGLSTPLVRTDQISTKGMVLAAGGRTGASVGTSGGVVLPSAELYNPALGVWVPAGPMTDLRSDHTATLLRNGRVLMAGGNIGQAGVNDPFLQGAAIITDSADLYDPATNTFSPTNLLDTPRADHTATLLDGTSCVGGRTSPCDNVLAAGRIDGSSGGGDTSEIYNHDVDPTPDIDDEWAAVSDPLNAERANHTATLLNNGKVLVAGGVDGAGAPGSTAALASAELFTP